MNGTGLQRADIRRVERFPSGMLQMPPSKSVLHRAILCAALAGGGSVHPPEGSQDIEATRRCMAGVREPGATLECGESGSTLRFLIPVAAALTGNARFVGRGRLMARPMAPYVDALGENGVRLRREGDGWAVRGKLRPGTYRLPGDVSSQFITGLLLALPLLDGDSTIELTTALESAGYVDLTLDVMAAYGVRAWAEGDTGAGGSAPGLGAAPEAAGPGMRGAAIPTARIAPAAPRRYRVPGGQSYARRDYAVEGDYSQAAFFLVAAALGCPCTCAGLKLDSRQGDRAILELLCRSGAEVVFDAGGGITARAGVLSAQTVDAADIPDLVPPLAALLCLCRGTSRIENCGRLRHKESDRLAAIREELGAIGADIRIEGDALVIRGVPALTGGRLNARGDHRIAMMGAVAAIRSRGPVEILGADSVAKSYPDFWRDFEKTERGAVT